MPNAISQITITHSAKIPVLDVQRKLCQPTGSQRDFILELINELKGFASGARNGSMIVQVESGTNTTKASVTGTFTGVVTAAQTVTIGGVVLTARASPATEDEFLVGSDETTQAAALVSTINANSNLAGLVVASNVAGVITISAVVPGRIGNLITVAETLGNFTFAASATKFSGATATLQAAARTFDFGGTA